MNDRRRKTRRQADQSHFVYDSKTGAVMGRVADMTEQGLMLLADKQIQPDTKFQCRMPLPENTQGNNDISFEAESKWCLLDEKSGQYHTGYEFRTMTADNIARLQKLLKSWPKLQPEAIKT
ncbi:PilZ domain-containing protein [Candidatus Zixiibacteriota bacterium]